MARSEFIYLGIKGCVIALNSTTGRQVWVRDLKGMSFVNVVLAGNNLLAATQGEIFCLDAQSGVVRWHNRLKGYGLGLVSIAGEGIAASAWNALASEKRRRDEAASSSASVSSTAT